MIKKRWFEMMYRNTYNLHEIERRLSEADRRCIKVTTKDGSGRILKVEWITRSEAALRHRGLGR